MMPGTSSKSKVVAVRLPNEAIKRIEKLLKHQYNKNTSVSDYCKVAILRYLNRHDKKR